MWKPSLDCHIVCLGLQVVGGDSGPVVCGAGTDFLVQPHDRGTASAPRKLSSPEALSATITGEAAALLAPAHWLVASGAASQAGRWPAMNTEGSSPGFSCQFEASIASPVVNHTPSMEACRSECQPT